MAEEEKKGTENFSGKDKLFPGEYNGQAGPEIVRIVSSCLDDILHWESPSLPEMLTGIAGSQKSLVIAAAMKKYRQVLVIVPQQKDVLSCMQDLKFFTGEAEILPFPIVEEASFQVTFTGTERFRDRMRALGALLSRKPCIVVATAVEAAQKIPSPAAVEEGTLTLDLGKGYDREELLEKLVSMGYERTVQVERCGHFSVRGDIVDIFPINHPHPVRLEFFGDETDSIRSFHEDTQRSICSLERVHILPLRQEGRSDSSVFSYIKDGVLFYDEPQRSEENLKAYFREESANKERAFPWDEMVRFGRQTGAKSIVFSLLNRALTGFRFEKAVTWKGHGMANYQRQLSIFSEDLKSQLHRGEKVFLLVPRPSEEKEIEDMLSEQHIPFSHDLEEGNLILVRAVLSGGFELENPKLAVITAGDILGRQKVRTFRSRNKSKGNRIRYFSDLNPGDYVVQDMYGIGKYLGLKTIELSGIHRDYIAIQYAGSDKLYLPVEQISTLEKYIGPEGETPKLHKMNGAVWERIRSKTRKSIEELAEKLLDVYAKREIIRGIAFAPDTAEQREFEDSFPYVETEDQLTAVESIKKAMEKPVPMDMLLCGDVGFGKTEVAMRAVFKCVMSGYQAMVLCPTTVLVEQHYKNFQERMEPFGVNVVVLNRFTKPKDRKKILADLKSGAVDVIIGTHAVLNTKVECRRLGLLVVDEEQRFGVVQKEKWKSISEGIDVLALSATPIPRTLHMSLSGVRDMVTITTPPLNRHSIQTYVTEYDDAIVRDAVLREKERGGQTYFVYNRIESISAMENHLRNILPKEVRIAVAYGRMDGASLEQIMMDFYERKFDVLLCTTLIENGLDQPNANTMLIYDADKLGLSQIYQMRGRIGRSDKIARAWFFYRKGKVLSEVAEKRLNTIREFTELGSGFKVAMRDLEIRGAGNLLGSAQHGNIAVVGFAAYCTMLEDAIERLRAVRENKPVPAKLPNTTIEFRQDAYLDRAYIEDEEQKMEVYRRLASVESEEALQDLVDEVIDRFGSPSRPAERLFHISEVRMKARKLGIGSIIDEGKSVLISWAEESFMKGWNPCYLPKEWIPYLHFLPGSPARLRVFKEEKGRDNYRWILSLLDELAEEVREGHEKSARQSPSDTV